MTTKKVSRFGLKMATLGAVRNMPSIRNMKIFATTSALSLCAATALTACGGTETDKVRARAATDLPCDEKSISVQSLGATSPEDTLYTAAGCGRTQRYVCTQTMIEQVRRARVEPRTDCHLDVANASSH